MLYPIPLALKLSTRTEYQSWEIRWYLSIVYMHCLCYLCSYSMPCYIDTNIQTVVKPQEGCVVIELYLMLFVVMYMITVTV